ncbi:acetylhydrolase [Streptomyces sp. WMMB 322]|uniref:alpha/beta hydrolase family protein n=1 Tax=Streptomyces sp. WMMB 322 TaxID=1286821 RepID=UPI0006E45F19|nr:acetylhydrolase [Streptomyces sp. WMMB 322]SCK10597.1 Predicted dienelactone hydrolase [Streptomyces sp. WMMB 322]
MPITRTRRPAVLASAVLALALPLPAVTSADAVAAGRFVGAASAAETSTPAAPESATARQPPVRAAQSGLELPPPSGPYGVGRDVLHLVDGSRPDPWLPETGARELMVSMYYPTRHPTLHLARHGTDRHRAPYMTEPEAKALLEGQKLADKVPAETLTSVRTNARPGARPAPGRHPLVVLSPGFTLQRGTLSVLAEELAGRGYVVAVLDHAHESYGTSFPGGRFTACAACEAVEQVPDGAESAAVMAKVARGRSADISFVLDRLTGPRPAWRHARLIDGRRIGAAGHSIGGNAAAQVMADDPRVRAGVNMDGTFFAPLPRRGLHGRPFLLLGTASGHSPGGEDESWDRGWARLDGWKRWLTVTGAGHFTFIDLPVLGAQLGMTDPDAPLPGDRSGQITRDYVGAFFDRQLRGIPQPLLNGPSPANPEVGFEHP